VIGVFDSGVGGLTALYELRRLLPRVNLTYLADRENAPYGTKSAEEILRFSKNNISRLRSLGAEKILIACCTAGTLYPYLSPEEQEISVPIIKPASRAALAATKNKRVAVIATRATVRSRAFALALEEHADCKILQCDAQELVSLVESGTRDSRPLTKYEESILAEATAPVLSFGADTLILGCTHFPHLMGHIARLLPGVTLINPSLEGALEIAKYSFPDEDGRTVYL